MIWIRYCLSKDMFSWRSLNKIKQNDFLLFVVIYEVLLIASLRSIKLLLLLLLLGILTFLIVKMCHSHSPKAFLPIQWVRGSRERSIIHLQLTSKISLIGSFKLWVRSFAMIVVVMSEVSLHWVLNQCQMCKSPNMKMEGFFCSE